MKINPVIYTAEEIINERDIVRWDNQTREEIPIDLACVFFNAEGNLMDDKGIIETAGSLADEVDCKNWEVVKRGGKYALMIWEVEE